jgi:hypothetical protein
MPSNKSSQESKTSKSHAPQDSVMFERVIPALLIVLGVVMVLLILFAAGVLLGIVHF